MISHCIAGAVIYCAGFMYVPGKLAYASPQPQGYQWAWSYTVPGFQQQLPVVFPVTRRG